MELFLPEDYPMTAPKVRVPQSITSIFKTGFNGFDDCHKNAKGTVHHSDLSPEHRQVGKNLPRHPQREMESSTSDQNRPSLHPGETSIVVSF